MTRANIIQAFRVENPDMTENRISDALLHIWCKALDKEIAAHTRCVPHVETWTTVADQQSWDLTDKIARFYDIDEFPGGGVAWDNERLTETSIAELDENTPNWRENSSGTPDKYYRRGKYIYTERPVDDAQTMKVYAILISQDFNDDDKEPFDELSYLEPFHYSIVKGLTMRARYKAGDEQAGIIAQREFEGYKKWMRKSIGGFRFGKIRFIGKG